MSYTPRVTWTLFLVLTVPLAASATSTLDLTNSGGTLSGSASGLTLTGSTLVVVTHWNGAGRITGNLGSETFTTGPLLTGSLQTGGTFAAGGSFTITGNGTNGIPNGVIFSGTFSSPVRWTLIPGGISSYTLTGRVFGTLTGGLQTGGPVDQLTDLVFNSATGYFDGSLPLLSGDTGIMVPEPGTLILLGTGILGVAGAFRRKWTRQS
jgi:hypothetical protein